MKLINARCAILVLIGLVILSCGAVSTVPAIRGDRVVFDASSFAEFHLGSLEVVRVIESPAGAVDILAGDVAGTGAPEIVVVEPSAVRVFTSSGDEMDSFPKQDIVLGRGLLADADDDGKLDIFLGTTNSEAARLIVLNGQGALLRDDTWFQLIQGDTIPWTVNDGTVYLTAYSRMNISPKIIAAVPVSGGDPDWTVRTKYLPVALSLGAEDGNLAVATRGLCKDRDDAGLDARNAISVISRDGKILLEQMIGGPHREGYPQIQNSGIRSMLYDLDGDGSAEIVSIFESSSALYQSPTTLRVTSADGDVVAEKEGPHTGEGSLSCYTIGDRTLLQLWWSLTGEGIIYDATLNELYSVQLPGALHDARIVWAGDLDGDGDVESLVSDLDVLHVMDHELKIVCSYPVPGSIRKALVVPDENNNPVIVVLANSVTILRLSDSGIAGTRIHTSPPGAAITIDGRLLNHTELPVLMGIAPGDHVFSATLDGTTISQEVSLRPGQFGSVRLTFGSTKTMALKGGTGFVDLGNLRRIASARKPDGYFMMDVGDFAGEAESEILLNNSARGGFVLLDSNLQTTASFMMDRSLGAFRIIDDLDGDGKLDIAAANAFGLFRVEVYTADGLLVSRVPVTYGFDSVFTPFIGRDGILYASVLTGHLLSPRGLYGIDIGNNDISFFYPKAGFINGVLINEDLVYLNDYTPENGLIIIHPDGETDSDGVVQLHVITTAGRRNPISGPFATENERGIIRYFLVDSDADGTEVYFMLNRDSSYNPGETGIYRIEKDGRYIQVHAGPENASGTPYPLVTGDGVRIVVNWYGSDLLEILDAEFRVLRRISKGERTIGAPLDIDGDGSIELLLAKDGAFTIETLDGKPLVSIGLPAQEVISYRVEDLNDDGTWEVILQTKEEIHVYGN